MRLAAVRIVLLAAAIAAGAGQALAEKRVALVIGNSAYQHAAPLKNPRNDANALAQSLIRLGFEVVKGLDLDKADFERTVRDFSRRLRGADVALLFYAGHGLQVNGVNYLAPIDAVLDEEGDLDFEALTLNTIQRQMERETKVNLVFLDACRDNPLARSLARSMGRTRSAAVGRGLARVETGNVESFIAFATDPGEVASDGDGRNSPFTTALLKHIETPGLDVAVLMRRVRKDVMAETKERQRPWTNSSLIREFKFNARAIAVEPGPKPPGTPQPNPADGIATLKKMLEDLQRQRQPTAPVAPKADPAKQAWEAVKDTESQAVLQAFVTRFPSSVYSDFARARLEELRRKAARPAPTPAPAPAPTPPPVQATPRPSFNCAYAKLPVEIAICNSVELADLDVQMSRLFFQRKARLRTAGQRWLKSVQRNWLAQRNACGSNAGCIRQRYLERIRALGG